MASTWSERDLSGVDLGRLGRLWAAAVDRPPDDPAEVAAPPRHRPAELADALRRQLAARPAAAADVAGDAGADPAPPATWADVLASPAPPADLLRRLKEWAKPRMARDDGEVPPAVAGVLYFAAVAVAATRAVPGVTTLPAGRVAEGARWALRLPWVDPDTRTLFAEAVTALGPPAPPSPSPSVR